MLLGDLLDIESIALERLFASQPSAINEHTVRSICKLSQKQARTCLKAWNHFGYVKTMTHSSGGYGIRKQNVFTDKTKNLFGGNQEDVSQRVDRSRIQVSTYNKLFDKDKYLNTHEKDKPSHVKEKNDQVSDKTRAKCEDLDQESSPFEAAQLADRERLREAEKAAAKNAARERFVAEQRNRSKKRKSKRYMKPRSEWTPVDMANEFADRLSAFHIEPWEVIRTRFAPALGDARKRFNNQADIEYLMILKFVETVDIKVFRTGDALWRNFIYLYPRLMESVRAQYSTPEEIERNDKIVERSRQKLMELKRQLEDERSNVQD